MVVPTNPVLGLRSLPDLRLRRSRLRELVCTQPPSQIRTWLSEVLIRARLGDADAPLTMVAWASMMAASEGDRDLEVALALLPGSPDEQGVRGPRVCRSAELGGLFFAVLGGPAAHRALPPRVHIEGGGWLRGRHRVPPRFEREVRARGDVAVTGLTRRPHPRVVERAYRHDAARFRAGLLEEGWVTERDVLAMASLRPSTEAMLLVIARNDRWFFHEAVREALCNNPYTPSWLAASLVPAASTRTRRHLVQHEDLRLARLAAAWVA